MNHQTSVHNQKQLNTSEYDKPEYLFLKQANIQYEDVVIVGAGPIGLAAAAEFANLGIKSVVLETSNSFSDGSKAICWSQRTLEILDRSGSAKKMLRRQ